jgi:hypothetical protein
MWRIYEKRRDQGCYLKRDTDKNTLAVGEPIHFALRPGGWEELRVSEYFPYFKLHEVTLDHVLATVPQLRIEILQWHQKQINANEIWVERKRAKTEKLKAELKPHVGNPKEFTS